MEEFFKEVLRSIVRLGISLDVWPTVSGVDTSSLVNQTYRGDVTLLPRRIFWGHRFAATNLTREVDIKWYLNEGMIMTFEKTPLIRARLSIEELVSSLKNELLYLAPRQRMKSASASRASDLSRKLQPVRRRGDIPQTLGSFPSAYFPATYT
eukprot:Protomagalhaensia_sp_Gyna_25__2067@NODE_210_length_4395_cov_146_337925_g164_i0_p3_GENE_NODE_210_length_4395_cov_146_337925_g164_i0NODE_210_length_4395_cov_146_337925_g164_i0_p3_ORF_typecomplete_len152_score20_58_NODE_210_length_4395_cov_146_337925_g164_i018072262